MAQRDFSREFARETGELTAERWKIGLTIYLAFAALGAIVEWQMYPQRGFLLLVAYSGQLVVVAIAWMCLDRSVAHPASAWIALIGNSTLCLILAVYNAAVHGDMLYVLLTYLAFMTVSSMFIPWGARFQLALNTGVIAAYLLAIASGGRVGPVPAYDFIAVAAISVLSTLGARYIDEYRRRLFEQAATLREVNEKLHLADKTRTELLSGLSHDMRTPLSVLTGYAGILSESPILATELQQPVRSIAREARELLHLVDGVLDLARLETGQLPFQRSVFRLTDALDPLRETTEDLLRDRSVRLHWNVPADLTLDSDARKVCEIARNLLSNAVKYTRQGDIRLAVSEVGNGVQLTVSDSGVGIAPEHVDLIFHPFRQLDDGGAGTMGSGFGLYLVKLLVDLLGGRIEVHSIPSAGSTFDVWLPPQPRGE
jgi:signal transduction histidine kinase